jgi:hypothetical protein
LFRFILALIVAVVSCNIAVATPQASDTLMFGGRKYAIHEIPMLGLWDYGNGRVGTGKQKPPAFDFQDSANWAGYRAQFEIRDSKLFLRRIVGRIDGKKRKNEEIIPGNQFPILADWYTGKIHLAVGDFDEETRESTAVIIFEVEKGAVKSVGFAERMKPVSTWNGVPADAPIDEGNAEHTHAPEPAAMPN